MYPSQTHQSSMNEAPTEPQRRVVNTFKIALLCLMLSLIVILCSTVATLYLILDARQNAIAHVVQQSSSSSSSRTTASSNYDSDSSSGSKLNSVEDEEEDVEQAEDVDKETTKKGKKVLTLVGHEDVHRSLKSYKILAPDPRSPGFLSDAEFAIALQKMVRKGIRRMKINADDDMMVILSSFKKNIDELQKLGTPYSSTSDYRSYIKRAYSGKKIRRKTRRITDMPSWVKYHLENANFEQLVEVFKSLPVFKHRALLQQKNYSIDEENRELKENSLETYYSLKRASDLGNPHAQSALASYYASGVFPWGDISIVRDQPSLNTTVASDFSDGGDQLANALVLWHFAAIGGVTEAQMAMGFRYSPKVNGNYGLEASCEKSLAYYEEAANAAIDELEASPLRAKVMPAHDGHRLSEIYIHGGASSALSLQNKPNELEEALEYYRILALNHEDEHAALTLGAMYTMGARGVPQDMSLAFKYYKIAADKENREACGQVGKFYLLGQGVEQNMFAAYKYCLRGAPGDITCSNNCDPTALNCLGQLFLRGVPFRLGRNVEKAMKIFKKARDLGSVDAIYNLGMIHLGWLGDDDVSALTDLTLLTDVDRIAAAAAKAIESGKNEIEFELPKETNLQNAYKLFHTAGKQGHLQALHRAGLMASRGIGQSDNEPNCKVALNYLSQVAEASPAMSRRTRAAYKEYVDGNMEQALRHYMIAGEAGVELAQSNAAFLLERGTCLGMDSLSCASASLRMWKASARQGNAEASLKVGDFHYYGKHRTEATSRSKTYDFLNGVKKRIILLIRKYLLGEKQKSSKKSNSIDQVCDANEDEGTCSDTSSNTSKVISSKDMDYEIAATFYRKAAETSSPQANFNLGYMHQWGIGLRQDFPLAKRYYDLAGNHVEAELPVYFALAGLKAHQWWIRVRPNILVEEEKVAIISDHVLRKDSFIIVLLLLFIFLLSAIRRERNR